MLGEGGDGGKSEGGREGKRDVTHLVVRVGASAPRGAPTKVHVVAVATSWREGGGKGRLDRCF